MRNEQAFPDTRNRPEALARVLAWAKVACSPLSDLAKDIAALEREDLLLVPREPTPKMIAATWDHDIDKNGGIESQNTRNRRIWDAMLSADLNEGEGE